MHPELTPRTLSSLIQFEIDVVKAYNQAVVHIADGGMREEIYRIKADIERHVLEMSELVRCYGVEPPLLSRDLRGYLMACVTALRSAEGTQGAIRAMQAIAEACVQRYDSSRHDDLPMEVAAMLEANQADVRRHVSALEAFRLQPEMSASHPDHEPD